MGATPPTPQKKFFFLFNQVFVKILYSYQKTSNTHCRKKSDFCKTLSSLGKPQRTFPWSFRQDETFSHFTCLFKWGKNTGEKKKCQLAINLPPLSCPNPPMSPLILLFFLHLYFTITLLCGQYSHTLLSSRHLSHSRRWAAL